MGPRSSHISPQAHSPSPPLPPPSYLDLFLKGLLVEGHAGVLQQLPHQTTTRLVRQQSLKHTTKLLYREGGGQAGGEGTTTDMIVSVCNVSE